MRDAPMDAAERIAQLRRDFDEVFASPHREKAEDIENLLAIRVQGDLYGLMAREIAGVERAGPLVSLPSRSPGLLGIMGYRGAILPVYDLATLMGYERRREAPRFFVRCGQRDSLALAVEEFDGYVRVPRTSFHAPDRDPRKHVHRFARIGETVRAIVSVPSILGAIQGGF